MTEFAGDRLHFGRNDGGDQALDAVDRLRHLNSVLLVLGDVGVIQLVHETRLSIDQIVDFLSIVNPLRGLIVIDDHYRHLG